MDRTLSVRTPESIAFSYELAGLGSRFLAVSVDMAIQTLIVIGIFAGAAAAASRTPARLAHGGGTEGVAIVVAVLFFVFFGYFIAFEAWSNGRTPGKRALGIRVVRDGGYPLDFGGSAIRNLVRVGEIALGFYAVSAVTTILNEQNKRLGDIAAGTIVIREERAAPLRASAGDAHAPSGKRLSAMFSEEELALIDRFMSRRESLGESNRGRLAAQIAEMVRPRVSRDLQRLEDEVLLRYISDS